MAFTDNPILSPEALFTLSGNVLAGPTFQQGLGAGVQSLGTMIAANRAKAKTEDEANKTREWLQQQYPDQDFSGFSGDTLKAAASEVLKQKITPAKPDYMAVKGLVFDKTSGQWIQPPADMMAADNPPEYGLNPQYGEDAEGNPVLIQLSKDGRSTQTPLPEGVKLSKQPIKLDAGTHFVLIDPITRRQIGAPIPKDIAGVEEQKEIGTVEGKQKAAAPGDLQAGLNAKAKIEELRVDPNREWATGWTSMGNTVMSTPGYDYQTKVDEAKAGAFLTAIQQLRGMGALSNAEGQTATAAITRMNTSTSEKEFLDALDDYEKIIDQGIQKAQSRIAPAPAAQIDQSQQPADGVKTTTTGIPWKKK